MAPSKLRKKLAFALFTLGAALDALVAFFGRYTIIKIIKMHGFQKGVPFCP